MTAIIDEALEILADTEPEYGDRGLANQRPLTATMEEREAPDGCE